MTNNGSATSDMRRLPHHQERSERREDARADPAVLGDVRHLEPCHDRFSKTPMVPAEMPPHREEMKQ